MLLNSSNESIFKQQSALNKQAKSDMSSTEEIKNLKIILLESESFQSFLQVSFMYYFSSHFLINN